MPPHYKLPTSQLFGLRLARERRFCFAGATSNNVVLHHFEEGVGWPIDIHSDTNSNMNAWHFAVGDHGTCTGRSANAFFVRPYVLQEVFVTNARFHGPSVWHVHRQQKRSRDGLPMCSKPKENARRPESPHFLPPVTAVSGGAELVRGQKEELKA